LKRETGNRRTEAGDWRIKRGYRILEAGYWKSEKQ